MDEEIPGPAEGRFTASSSPGHAATISVTG